MSVLENSPLGDERSQGAPTNPLFEEIYSELRKLAARMLAQEKPGQTLQPTALVHEAYLRLTKDDPAPRWRDQRHFAAAAAEAMRRILVENARRKQRQKHGGEFQRVAISEDALPAPGPSDDLLALDEALTALGAEEPRKADLVKLRYFTGLSLEEAADVLGVSRATAARDWTYARAWLYEHISAERAAGPKDPSCEQS